MKKKIIKSNTVTKKDSQSLYKPDTINSILHNIKNSKKLQKKDLQYFYKLKADYSHETTIIASFLTTQNLDHPDQNTRHNAIMLSKFLINGEGTLQRLHSRIIACKSDPNLITQWIKINAQKESYETSLHWLAARTNQSIPKVLFTKNEVNSKDKDGNTPCHLAVQNGHENLMESLISLGADVNAKNENGNTTLHLAVQNGHENLMESLISLGADVNVKNNQGQTASDLMNTQPDKGNKMIGGGIFFGVMVVTAIIVLSTVKQAQQNLKIFIPLIVVAVLYMMVLLDSVSYYPSL